MKVTDFPRHFSGVIFSLLIRKGDKGDAATFEGESVCKGARSFHSYFLWAGRLAPNAYIIN